jgi:hypothetical protein
LVALIGRALFCFVERGGSRRAPAGNRFVRPVPVDNSCFSLPLIRLASIKMSSCRRFVDLNSTSTALTVAVQSRSFFNRHDSKPWIQAETPLMPQPAPTAVPDSRVPDDQVGLRSRAPVEQNWISNVDNCREIYFLSENRMGTLLLSYPRGPSYWSTSNLAV